MTTIDSPCTKVCTLHPTMDLCVGCGRTSAEIALWPALSRDERIAMMGAIGERLARLQSHGWTRKE
jgi:predicted Fe-S protein YdhL (DUF1289 family)